MDRRMPEEVAALQRRVEAWRADGGGRGRKIPEELWDAAVAVARTAGLYMTARALRFGYQNLKVRVTRASQTRKRGRTQRAVASRRPEFVAVTMPPSAGGAQMVVALVARDGEQMRMEVSGASAMDMVALAQAFWGRRS